MTSKKSVITTASILMAALVLLFASDSSASFYRPKTALTILSEYAVLDDSAPPRTQVWKVVPESAADGGAALRFFPEAPAGAEAVGELFFPPPGSAGEIRWRGRGEGAEKSSNSGLLLAPGFPAPCDVLPVGVKEEGLLYQEKRQAGGSVFIKSYHVSSEAVSIDQARARGWIREEAPGVTGLVMVTAADEQGRPAVRQLWPVDGSWWLYEETPLRRSWLSY